jgi:hypothetical protein
MNKISKLKKKEKVVCSLKKTWQIPITLAIKIASQSTLTVREFKC